MPVSSYVVRFEPGAIAGVAQRLNALPQVTVGPGDETGIPVVAETCDTQEARLLGAQLEETPGVLSATLIYHNFEDIDPSQPEK